MSSNSLEAVLEYASERYKAASQSEAEDDWVEETR